MTPNELKTLKKLLDQLTLMVAEAIARIKAKIDLMIGLTIDTQGSCPARCFSSHKVSREVAASWEIDGFESLLKRVCLETRQTPRVCVDA